MGKIEIGQLRCESHMEDVIYEIVDVDDIGQYRVIYHVLDDFEDSDKIVINDLAGIKLSADLDMWFDAGSLFKDTLWRETIVERKKSMPSF